MKFKVEDKVCFTARPEYCSECRKDSGKIGEVVYIYEQSSYSNFIDIKIPDPHLGKDAFHIWKVRESALSFPKNYQMLFPFMGIK